MKIGIAIPWRPQPSRIVAFDFVLDYYSKILPDVQIYFGDKKGEKWNMGGSRNIACQKAFSDGCDVVMVVDADLCLKKENLLAACEYAFSNDLVVVPYSKLVVIPEENVVELSKLGPEKYLAIYQNPRIYNLQVGGACAISSKYFEQCNGWDERFTGWGYEDSAFALVHHKLTGSDFFKVDGVGLWLNHSDRDKSTTSLNEKLYKFYVTLNTEQLREWIKGNRFELI